MFPWNHFGESGNPIPILWVEYLHEDTILDADKYLLVEHFHSLYTTNTSNGEFDFLRGGKVSEVNVYIDKTVV